MRFQKRRGNPKTNRVEEKYTQRRETTSERIEQKHPKCIRDKKRLKRQQDIQKNLEDFKGVSSIPGIKSVKKKVFITKIRNERGELITSRKGLANVFGEFCEKLYGDTEQDEYGNESNIDVHISDTEETTRIPEITSEELEDAIRKLKKRSTTRQRRDSSRRHQSL